MISLSNWANRKQNIQRQSAEGRGGVELLRHGNEAYRASIEPVDQSREVEKRTAQPINLIYDDAIDVVAVDVFE